MADFFNHYPFLFGAIVGAIVFGPLFGIPAYRLRKQNIDKSA